MWTEERSEDRHAEAKVAARAIANAVKNADRSASNQIDIPDQNFQAAQQHGQRHAPKQICI